MVNIKFLIKSILWKTKVIFAKLTYFRRTKIGKNLRLNGNPFVQSKGDIVLGSNCIINSGNASNPIGAGSFTNIVVKHGAKLVIGDNVGLSNTTLFVSNSVTIEPFVKIGGGCKIWDTDHHSIIAEDRNNYPEIKPVGKPVLLCKGCWLSGDVTVLKGITIGQNAVIAYGSVVTKNIPANQLWGGIPAKFISDIPQ